MATQSTQHGHPNPPSKPPASSRGRKATVGATAGAAPLVVALIAGAVFSGNNGQPSAAAVQHGQAAVKCESVENMQTCHADYPTGCSGAGGYDAYLNLLKNQLTAAPAVSQSVPVLSQSDYQSLDRSLPSGLAKSNHSQFQGELQQLGEGKQHQVIGYLFYYRPSGAESSNCELSGPEDVDFHIGIGFDSTIAAKAQSGKKLASAEANKAVIVEMTPHYRSAYHPEWTLEALQKVLGKQVKVTGQLIVDNEHDVPSQNCALPNAGSSCWRASVWELHPVTKFEVCNKPGNDCSASDTGWAELQ